jgi:hypothetical protein
MFRFRKNRLVDLAVLQTQIMHQEVSHDLLASLLVIVWIAGSHYRHIYHVDVPAASMKGYNNAFASVNDLNLVTSVEWSWQK